jgi:hypothetical protein
MADEHIERRTYVGETAASTQAIDSFCGFRIGQSYLLRYRVRVDGTIGIALDHAPTEGRVLVVTKQQFGKWFVK